MSTAAVLMYGRTVRALRNFTNVARSTRSPASSAPERERRGRVERTARRREGTLRPDRRHVVGSDHAHRRQPRHPHQDRLRQARGRRVLEHVVDLSRLQRVHEGQGPARRALHHEPHLRHLRRQPRHLLDVRAEHGVRHQAAAPRRVDRQPRRSGRVHVRPQPVPGQPGRRRLLREDGAATNPGVFDLAERTEAPHARRPRLPHDRRHHARAQPVHRRAVPRSAADEPAHARDVLPDGRPARAPVDALSRRRRHRADACSCSPTT